MEYKTCNPLLTPQPVSVDSNKGLCGPFGKMVLMGGLRPVTARQCFSLAGPCVNTRLSLHGRGGVLTSDRNDPESFGHSQTPLFQRGFPSLRKRGLQPCLPGVRLD